MGWPETQERPGDQTGATQKLNGDQTSSSLASIDPRDDIARHVDGTFVLVVKSTGGKPLWKLEGGGR